jgi:hypothetical protein
LALEKYQGVGEDHWRLRTRRLLDALPVFYSRPAAPEKALISRSSLLFLAVSLGWKYVWPLRFFFHQSDHHSVWMREIFLPVQFSLLHLPATFSSP